MSKCRSRHKHIKLTCSPHDKAKTNKMLCWHYTTTIKPLTHKHSAMTYLYRPVTQSRDLSFSYYYFLYNEIYNT